MSAWLACMLKGFSCGHGSLRAAAKPFFNGGVINEEAGFLIPHRVPLALVAVRALDMRGGYYRS
jgi:hypothetical protein